MVEDHLAPFSTEEFRSTRPQIVGPDTPSPPFPIELHGTVTHGFGRGGKDLGCPTANLPDDSITPLNNASGPGVYYGYAQIIPTLDAACVFSSEETRVWPMVMSLGWNPFYENEKMTAEIHVMHNFSSDFYGQEMKVLVLGYIRPELNYTSRDALIADIDTDKQVALNSLDRPDYRKFATDAFFVFKGSD